MKRSFKHGASGYRSVSERRVNICRMHIDSAPHSTPALNVLRSRRKQSG